MWQYKLSAVRIFLLCLVFELAFGTFIGVFFIINSLECKREYFFHWHWAIQRLSARGSETWKETVKKRELFICALLNFPSWLQETMSLSLKMFVSVPLLCQTVFSVMLQIFLLHLFHSISEFSSPAKGKRMFLQMIFFYICDILQDVVIVDVLWIFSYFLIKN